MNGTKPLSDVRNGPWRFLPDGAIVHEPDKLAVISDLHLGYDLARAVRGDFLPRDSGEALQQRLGELFRRSGCTRLVIAGDVVESSMVLAHDAGILKRLTDWTETRGVELVLIQGNHDGHSLPGVQPSLEIDGWVIRHGHESVHADMRDDDREISGHSHPVLRWGGRKWRVFLNAHDRIVLPAFSADASGSDVLDARIFPDEAWGDAECVVCRSDDVVSFGTLRELRSMVITPAKLPGRSMRRSGGTFRR